MNQDYKEKLSRKIEKHYSDLEERIMQDIVRRIKQYGKITSTADWQINRLAALGNSSEDIEKMLKQALNASYPEMFELYDKVIDWEYVRSKDLYEQINANFIPYEDNHQLQQLTEALMRQTQNDLENITQSLGFYLDYGNGKRVMTPLSEIYQGYLDSAMLDITSGAFSYDTVLRRTVTQLTNSGLRTIDYASGRHYRVNVAARTAVMTGISQLTGKITDMNAEKLGAEYFEVAWHAGARPEHAEWQGKVWTKEELVTVCGLGSVTGLLGANCYHEYYCFFPGISERNWTDEWLEEQNRKENTPKEWFGKEYTLYQAKQKQRQMETAMRAQREKVKLLQEGDADPDEVMLARAKYQAQLDEYARFSKKMGLKQERARIYLDRRGFVASNTKRQNAKYTSEMMKNASKDLKEFEKYKNIIGIDVGSLADFRQMKYNDTSKYKLLKSYVKSVDKGMITRMCGFENYVKTYYEIEKSVIGIKTSNAIEIVGQSEHFMERVIGTMSDPKNEEPRSGVSVEGIIDALVNPLDVKQIKIGKDGKRSQKFIGENGTITVNPDTGILIQCNPTSSDVVARYKK